MTLPSCTASLIHSPLERRFSVSCDSKYAQNHSHDTFCHHSSGTTEQMTAKIAITELGLPITVEQFHELFSTLCRKRFSNLSLMEGAERLLLHLHKHKVPTALATSSSKEMADIKMSGHRKLFDLFHHKVMGSTDPDVKHGKPAPDIFLVAAERFPDRPKPETVKTR